MIASTTHAVAGECKDFSRVGIFRHSAHKTDRLSLWAQGVYARREHNDACVAVANTAARTEKLPAF